MTRRLWGLIAASAMLSGCGYHVAGHADVMPKNIRSIYVPAFGNVSIRYRIAETLPAAISRELIDRTRYRVVPKIDEADAVLYGSVLNYYAFGTTYDPVSNRASAVQVGVVMQVKLVDRSSGKILFERPSFEFKQRYEISVPQPNAPDQQLNRNVYFDESEPALRRLAQEVARSVVSGILENF